jgi:hypothetical protein
LRSLIAPKYIEIARGDLARILHGASANDAEYIFGDSIGTLTQDGMGVDVSFERSRPHKFHDWCKQVMRSRIEPMKKIARTLRSHCEPLLNYFRAKRGLASGVVEGLNNKAKLTMRKSYGFRTFRVIALYHAPGKLPEPNVDHRFF